MNWLPEDWDELTPEYSTRYQSTEDLIALVEARGQQGDPIPVDVQQELVARGIDPEFMLYLSEPRGL